MSEISVLAMVDASGERRAAITNAHSRDNIAIIPFEGVDDVTRREGGPETYLVHDEGDAIAAVLAHLGERALWAAIVAYSERPAPTAVARAIFSGALAYLGYPFTHEELLESLAVLETRAQNIRERRVKAVRAKANLRRLSNRELQVVTGVSDGLSNKAIGKRLEISPRTVEIHRNNAIAKLGATSSYDAVRMVHDAEALTGH